jgi:hypothetical protein
MKNAENQQRRVHTAHQVYAHAGISEQCGQYGKSSPRKHRETAFIQDLPILPCAPAVIYHLQQQNWRTRDRQRLLFTPIRLG